MFPRGVGGPLGPSLGLPQAPLGSPMGMPMMSLPGGISPMGMGPPSMSPMGGQAPMTSMAPGLGLMTRGPQLLQVPSPMLGNAPVMQNNKMNKIWIKHLPQSATIVQLGVYFSSFGKVIDCEIIKDAQGRNTGVGYVCYDSEETAQREVVKQHMFQGQKLVLEPAYKFEMQPEFSDIVAGKITFPPLGKAAFPLDDDFEMHVSDGKNKARPKVDDRGVRRGDPGPPMFGGTRTLDSPQLMDAGSLARSMQQSIMSSTMPSTLSGGMMPVPPPQQPGLRGSPGLRPTMAPVIGPPSLPMPPMAPTMGPSQQLSSGLTLNPVMGEVSRMARDLSPSQLRRDGDLAVRREEIGEMQLQPRGMTARDMEGTMRSLHDMDPGRLAAVGNRELDRPLRDPHETSRELDMSIRGGRDLDNSLRTSLEMPVGQVPSMPVPVAPPAVQSPMAVMSPAPVPVQPPTLQPAGPPAIAPIHAQPVVGSAIYGPKVNLKPAPELTLQGENLKSVYVSNLTWWTTDEDVRNMVLEVTGNGIPFNIVFDEHKPNGKSLGSVFIDVQTEQIAQLVIKGLNGKVINRRELKAELFGQPADEAGAPSAVPQGDAARAPLATGHTANAVPVGDKRKPLDEGEDSGKKRVKSEPTEICKWHLEGGCKYESACPLLHPDLSQRKTSEGKDKASRGEKKVKEDDKERHRTSGRRALKEEKKEKPRKEGERHAKHEKATGSAARHRHRHHEESEESEGSETTDAKRRKR